MDSGFFCFGCFRLAIRERVLLKDDRPVTLGSRAFDLLVALVVRAGETVNREELFDLIWPDVVVSKVNLRVHVALLRKVLGDGRDGNRFIVSVAGRGYRFVAPVSQFATTRSESSLTASSSARLPHGPPREFRRDIAISSLGSQLSRKRFISVGGPGDWGRTIVALAIAHVLSTNLEHAVCLVDFTGVDDSAEVAVTVASALACEVAHQPPLSCILSYLRDKEMLLVFDNCDHVFEGVAQLVELLFSEAPLVHVLVNSREALCLSPVMLNPQRPNA